VTLRLQPIWLLLAGLHLYVGARLLPHLGLAGQLVGAAMLLVCFWLLPKGWHSREDGPLWGVLLPWIALGFFSWLVVLTVARDLAPP
jgi:hypothetical protein